MTKEKDKLQSSDTFEIHERMFKERIKEIKENNYIGFEELVKTANSFYSQ